MARNSISSDNLTVNVSSNGSSVKTDRGNIRNSVSNTSYKSNVLGTETWAINNETGATTKTHDTINEIKSGAKALLPAAAAQQRFKNLESLANKGHETFITDLGQQIEGTTRDILATPDKYVAAYRDVKAKDGEDVDRFVYDNLTNEVQELKANSTEGRGKLSSFAIEAIGSVEEQLVDRAVGAMIPGGDSLINMIVRIAPTNYMTARDKGMDKAESIINMAAKTSISYLTEQIGGGTFRGEKGYFDDKVWGGLGDIITSRTNSVLLGKLASSMSGEAFEEIVEAFADFGFDTLATSVDAKWQSDYEDFGECLNDAIHSAIVAGISAGMSGATVTSQLALGGHLGEARAESIQNRENARIERDENAQLIRDFKDMSMAQRARYLSSLSQEKVDMREAMSGAKIIEKGLKEQKRGEIDRYKRATLDKMILEIQNTDYRIKNQRKFEMMNEAKSQLDLKFSEVIKNEAEKNAVKISQKMNEAKSFVESKISAKTEEVKTSAEQLQADFMKAYDNYSNSLKDFIVANFQTAKGIIHKYANEFKNSEAYRTVSELSAKMENIVKDQYAKIDRYLSENSKLSENQKAAILDAKAKFEEYAKRGINKSAELIDEINRIIRGNKNAERQNSENAEVRSETSYQAERNSEQQQDARDVSYNGERTSELGTRGETQNSEVNNQEAQNNEANNQEIESIDEFDKFAKDTVERIMEEGIFGKKANAINEILDLLDKNGPVTSLSDYQNTINAIINSKDTSEISYKIDLKTLKPVSEMTDSDFETKSTKLETARNNKATEDIDVFGENKTAQGENVEASAEVEIVPQSSLTENVESENPDSIKATIYGQPIEDASFIDPHLSVPSTDSGTVVRIVEELSPSDRLYNAYKYYEEAGIKLNIFSGYFVAEDGAKVYAFCKDGSIYISNDIENFGKDVASYLLHEEFHRAFYRSTYRNSRKAFDRAFRKAVLTQGTISTDIFDALVRAADRGGAYSERYSDSEDVRSRILNELYAEIYAYNISDMYENYSAFIAENDSELSDLKLTRFEFGVIFSQLRNNLISVMEGKTGGIDVNRLSQLIATKNRDNGVAPEYTVEDLSRNSKIISDNDGKVHVRLGQDTQVFPEQTIKQVLSNIRTTFDEKGDRAYYYSINGVKMLNEKGRVGTYHTKGEAIMAALGRMTSLSVPYIRVNLAPSIGTNEDSDTVNQFKLLRSRDTIDLEKEDHTFATFDEIKDFLAKNSWNKERSQYVPALLSGSGDYIIQSESALTDELEKMAKDLIAKERKTTPDKIDWNDIENRKILSERVGDSMVVVKIENNDQSFAEFVENAVKYGVQIGGQEFSFAYMGANDVKSNKVRLIRSEYQDSITRKLQQLRIPLDPTWEFNMAKYLANRGLDTSPSQAQSFVDVHRSVVLKDLEAVIDDDSVYRGVFFAEIKPISGENNEEIQTITINDENGNEVTVSQYLESKLGKDYNTKIEGIRRFAHDLKKAPTPKSFDFAVQDTIKVKASKDVTYKITKSDYDKYMSAIRYIVDNVSIMSRAKENVQLSIKYTDGMGVTESKRFKNAAKNGYKQVRGSYGTAIKGMIHYMPIVTMLVNSGIYTVKDCWGENIDLVKLDKNAEPVRRINKFTGEEEYQLNIDTILFDSMVKFNKIYSNRADWLSTFDQSDYGIRFMPQYSTHAFSASDDSKYKFEFKDPETGEVKTQNLKKANLNSFLRAVIGEDAKLTKEIVDRNVEVVKKIASNPKSVLELMGADIESQSPMGTIYANIGEDFYGSAIVKKNANKALETLVKDIAAGSLLVDSYSTNVIIPDLEAVFDGILLQNVENDKVVKVGESGVRLNKSLEIKQGYTTADMARDVLQDDGTFKPTRSNRMGKLRAGEVSVGTANTGDILIGRSPTMQMADVNIMKNVTNKNVERRTSLYKKIMEMNDGGIPVQEYFSEDVLYHNINDLLMLRLDADVDGDHAIVTQDMLLVKLWKEALENNLKSNEFFITTFDHDKAQPVRLSPQAIYSSIMDGASTDKIGVFANTMSKIMQSNEIEVRNEDGTINEEETYKLRHKLLAMFSIGYKLSVDAYKGIKFPEEFKYYLSSVKDLISNTFNSQEIMNNDPKKIDSYDDGVRRIFNENQNLRKQWKILSTIPTSGFGLVKNGSEYVVNNNVKISDEIKALRHEFLIAQRNAKEKGIDYSFEAFKNECRDAFIMSNFIIPDVETGVSTIFEAMMDNFHKNGDWTKALRGIGYDNEFGNFGVYLAPKFKNFGIESNSVVENVKIRNKIAARIAGFTSEAELGKYFMETVLSGYDNPRATFKAMRDSIRKKIVKVSAEKSASIENRGLADIRREQILEGFRKDFNAPTISDTDIARLALFETAIGEQLSCIVSASDSNFEKNYFLNDDGTVSKNAKNEFVNASYAGAHGISISEARNIIKGSTNSKIAEEVAFLSKTFDALAKAYHTSMSVSQTVNMFKPETLEIQKSLYEKVHGNEKVNFSNEFKNAYRENISEEEAIGDEISYKIDIGNLGVDIDWDAHDEGFMSEDYESPDLGEDYYSSFSEFENDDAESLQESKVAPIIEDTKDSYADALAENAIDEDAEMEERIRVMNESNEYSQNIKADKIGQMKTNYVTDEMAETLASTESTENEFSPYEEAPPTAVDISGYVHGAVKSVAGNFEQKSVEDVKIEAKSEIDESMFSNVAPNVPESNPIHEIAGMINAGTLTVENAQNILLKTSNWIKEWRNADDTFYSEIADMEISKALDMAKSDKFEMNDKFKKHIERAMNAYESNASRTITANDTAIDGINDILITRDDNVISKINSALEKVGINKKGREQKNIKNCHKVLAFAMQSMNADAIFKCISGFSGDETSVGYTYAKARLHCEENMAKLRSELSKDLKKVNLNSKDVSVREGTSAKMTLQMIYDYVVGHHEEIDVNNLKLGKDKLTKFYSLLSEGFETTDGTKFKSGDMNNLQRGKETFLKLAEMSQNADSDFINVWYDVAKKASPYILETYKEINGVDMEEEAWRDFYFPVMRIGSQAVGTVGITSRDTEDTRFLHKNAIEKGAPLLIQYADRTAQGYLDQVSEYVSFANFNDMFRRVWSSKSRNQSDKETQFNEDERRTLSETIRHEFGEGAFSVIDNYFKDLNNQRPIDNTFWGSTIRHLRQNYSAAAIPVNPSVWIKQPASIFNTCNYLPMDSLMKNFKNVFNYLTPEKIENAINKMPNSIREAIRYRYEQQSIDPSYFEANHIGGFGSDILRTIAELSLKATSGKFDVTKGVNYFDIAAIIVEEQIAEEYWMSGNCELNKDKSLGIDSEEFGHFVFEMISLTQPNGTRQMRAEIQRTPNELIRSAFGMFRSQQIQNDSNLATALFEGNEQKAETTLGGIVTSSVVFGILGLIASGMKHKKDKFEEDGEFSASRTMASLAENVVDSLAGNVTGLNMITSRIINLLDSSYYTSDLTTDVFENLTQALDYTFRIVKNPTVTNMRKAATYWSSTYGIPAGQAYDLVNTIVMTGVDLVAKTDSGDITKAIDSGIEASRKNQAKNKAEKEKAKNLEASEKARIKSEAKKLGVSRRAYEKNTSYADADKNGKITQSEIVQAVSSKPKSADFWRKYWADKYSSKPKF